MNYLQTDDRDDYFKRFNTPIKHEKYYLVEKDGKMILEHARSKDIRFYLNRIGIHCKRGVWRKLLAENSYVLKDDKKFPKTRKK